MYTYGKVVNTIPSYACISLVVLVGQCHSIHVHVMYSVRVCSNYFHNKFTWMLKRSDTRLFYLRTQPYPKMCVVCKQSPKHTYKVSTPPPLLLPWLLSCLTHRTAPMRHYRTSRLSRSLDQGKLVWLHLGTSLNNT